MVYEFEFSIADLLWFTCLGAMVGFPSLGGRMGDRSLPVCVLVFGRLDRRRRSLRDLLLCPFSLQ